VFLQDWQHIQLMHIFQEQLVTGRGNRAGQYDRGGQTHLEALVDLQNLVTFEEHFYLVVVEKLPHAAHSVLHMWRVVIASESECPPTPSCVYGVPSLSASVHCIFILSFSFHFLSGPRMFSITFPGSSNILSMPLIVILLTLLHFDP
jgi:hypothetical protein